MDTRDMNDSELMQMIVNHIQHVEGFAETSWEFEKKLAKEPLLGYGVNKVLELAGEAAHYVSPQARGHFPKIDYDFWAELRTDIVHSYDGLDMAEIWRTVWQEIPNLRSALKEYGFWNG